MKNELICDILYIHKNKCMGLVVWLVISVVAWHTNISDACSCYSYKPKKASKMRNKNKLFELLVDLMDIIRVFFEIENTRYRMYCTY